MENTGVEDWIMIGGAEEYFNDVELYNKMGLEFASAYTIRISNLPVVIDFGGTASGPTAIQPAGIDVPALGPYSVGFNSRKPTRQGW